MTNLSTFYPNADTYIDSYHPNTNFNNCASNWIGRKNCKTFYRTLLKFDISSIQSDAIITRAILKLYVDYAQSPSTIGKFTPYAITSPWNEDTVTWNKCPSFDALNFGSTASIGGIGWYEWDVTQIIKAWFDKTRSNYGIILKDNCKVVLDNKRLVGAKNSKGKQTSPFSPFISVYYDLPQPPSNNVTLAGRKFIDKTINVKTTNDFIPTRSFNTSQQSLATFFIINTGQNPALVVSEVGPNDIDYVTEDTIFEVMPGKIIAVVPRIFAKYTRLIYKSTNPFYDTTLKIVFQSCI